MQEKLKSLVTRRNLVIAGGACAGAAVLLQPRNGGGHMTPVGAVDVDSLIDIGDGFYLADGWVLTAADLEGADLSRVKK